MLHQKAEFVIGFRSLESMGLSKILFQKATPKINEIPMEECVRVIDNFARRRRGAHFEHILERTWLLVEGF